MNCINCGGPLHLIPGKDYFRCPYCTTMHFPDENQDGVRALGVPSQVSCPACSTELISAAIDEIPILYCTKCRGILAEPPRFRRIVESRRVRSRKRATPPQPISRAEFARKLRCPECRRPMEVHPYYGPGNAVIDSCGFCALIWLDHGELNVIVSAPER